MSRPFDAGKSSYRKDHLRSNSGQQTRHLLGDDFMQHYGAKSDNYSQWCDNNYRMGSKQTNDRDRMIDNALLGSIFNDAGSKHHRQNGYDANYLAVNQGDRKCGRISYQQQRDAIGSRFDAAKIAYETTGEHKYLMIQKDLRDVAMKNLDADGRQWRLSSHH